MGLQFEPEWLILTPFPVLLKYLKLYAHSKTDKKNTSAYLFIDG